jgi:hypothetical protein
MLARARSDLQVAQQPLERLAVGVTRDSRLGFG